VTEVRYAVAALIALLLFACHAEKEPPVAARTAKAAVAPSRTVPFTFAEPWLRGAVSYDERTARSASAALPLTISLEVTDAHAASRQLRTTPFADTCLRVRLLYRRDPSEPARVLEAARPHTTSMWTPTPAVCLYAGLRWTWRIHLVSDGPLSRDRDYAVLLTSGGTRVSGEQIAIALMNMERSEGASLVAQSQWVSLVTGS
jgi:hypothetical protein